MCPTGCTCRDESLEAICSSAELEFIPIQLNPDLQVFDLKANRVSNILYALSIYTKLQHVDISSNRLQSVGSRNFQYQIHLRTLNMSHNQISSLGKEAFRGLTAIRLIDLSHNRIEKIDNHAFNDTVTLETLDLTYNRLTSLEGDTIFRSLGALRVLVLERNDMLDVPPALKSLPSHAQLSSLLLANNLIQTLDESSFPFPQLSNLTKLTLSNNVISDIHKSSFNSLHDLTTLDLSFNNLTQIPTQQLSKLTKLSSLDLSGNEFVEIGAVSFKSLFQLKFLRLSRLPRLSSIDARSFVDNIQLESIWITENLNLERLPTRVFHGNPNLNYVQMHGNSLATLDASHFPLDRLKALDISENPLNCNCSLLWLWVLVRLQTKASSTDSSSLENLTVVPPLNQRSLKINLHNLKCASPEEFRMRSVWDVPESAVRCETSWITIAMVSAVVLATVTVLLIGLFLIISGKRLSCLHRRKSSKASAMNSGSLESRGIIPINGGATPRGTPVLSLYPEKSYAANMLMSGYLMQQPESPSGIKQQLRYGSMEHWDPFASIGSARRVGNEYTNEIPRAKKVPHIVYV